MTTPVHTDLDSNNPQGSQTPANAMTSTLNNLRALRDAIVSGRLEGFVFTRIQGAGVTPTRSQFFQFLNGGLSIGFRWNVTWSGFQMATVADEWTNDSGATWTAINSAQANTYDVANNITASTNAGGMRALLFEVMTKVMQVVSDFTAHSIATGTAVHGLATMAIQAANSVLISGGSINGTSFGNTTRGSVDATRVTEGFLTYTPALNAAVTLDWSSGRAVVTTNGSNALNAFINVPSGHAGIYVEVDNFNNINNWATRFDFGAPGVPSIAGPARVGAETRDGAATKPKAWITWQ